MCRVSTDFLWQLLLDSEQQLPWHQEADLLPVTCAVAFLGLRLLQLQASLIHASCAALLLNIRIDAQGLQTISNCLMCAYC